jgi:glutamate transport system substrate-binding protein
MRYSRTKTFAGAAVMALALAACGEAGSGGAGTGGADVAVNEDASFDSGTMMDKLNKAGEVTIGVKIDQPGIGFKSAAAEDPTGFDIEMGKYVAAQLGIAPENIVWKETVSDNREPFLQNGTVDLVIASYSIDPERRAVVGQAGPYYVTGQQLLVREEDKNRITKPEDLRGQDVCSVTGSTSIETVETEYGANPRGFATYSECVDQVKNGGMDAMTTDGAILLGYAAEEPDALEVVGPEFSTEEYAIGYPKEETEMCQFLNDTIEQSYQDGFWKEAFESTLGPAGVKTPKPPKPDACPA